MAITSGLFNSVNGDRKYNDWWFAKYFSTFIGNGVFPNPSTGMQVVEDENMRTIVKAGDGWINGYFIHNDSNYILEHDIADGVLKRIDRIVMRLNFITRRIECVIVKGTFASSPVAPDLQRDADMHELGLADVLINNGVTQITQANITDLRLNSELCGIVHGVVDQVDTTTIFNQYLSWFQQITGSTEQEMNDWKDQQQQDFMDWFATIQDILDGDVAGNLANRILNLEQVVDNHVEDGFLHLQVGERQKWNDNVLTSQSLKTVKFDKDEEGIFTVIKTYRKSDDTLYQESVLSGGTSPLYTTRTVKTYAIDGTTVNKTDVYTLSYDADDVLESEV